MYVIRVVTAINKALLPLFHRLFLSPDSSAGQMCLSHDILLEGAQGNVRFDRDYFTNRCALLELVQAYNSINISGWSVIEVTRSAPAVSGTAWDEGITHPFAIDQWRYDSPICQADAESERYARTSFTPGRNYIEALFDLTQRIFNDFTYDGQATSIVTTPQESLQQRRGVCQDFAHVAVTCLRSIGLPAAYVSGYLETAPPEGQQRLIGADASHAWVALWVPGVGWVHTDPTNGCFVEDRHIITAMGRDFGDVSPISGIIYGGGPHQLEVAVDVIPATEWADHPLRSEWPAHCLPQ